MHPAKDLWSKFYRVCLVTFLSVILASCTDISDRLIPKVESDFAKEYLSRLMAEDYEYVRGYFSPQLVPMVSDTQLTQIAGFFHSGEVLSVELIGSEVHVNGDQWQGNFTFEYEFESGWNLASVALERVAESYQVIGFHVYQTEGSQGAVNAFTLADKSPLHFLMLVMAIGVVLFVLVTFIIFIKTPMPRKKWLWGIFILLGFSALRLNWTSGELVFQLLNLTLFGAAIQSPGPAAPWILSVSFPLGAVLFWLKRRKLLRERADEESWPAQAPVSN
ncbi:MAG: hypothetical protein JJU03_07390 [Idiomarina sp.]|nr:hypothetical protein [Idiomarina sp.]